MRNPIMTTRIFILAMCLGLTLGGVIHLFARVIAINGLIDRSADSATHGLAPLLTGD